MTILDKLFGKKKGPKSMSKEEISRLEDQGDVKGLVAILDDQNPDLRQAAVEALCKVGNVDAVKPLSRVLLNDEHWVVRRYAAEALGNIGVPDVEEPLTTALNNDPYIDNITGWRVVRITAEKALKKLQDMKTATAPLDRLLLGQWSSTSSSDEIMLLIETLKRNCNSIMDREVERSMEIIEILAKENDPIIAEAMCYTTLSANHWKVRNSAANVLKEITTPEINQLICEALYYDRENPTPADKALNALEIIAVSSTIRAILDFFYDFRVKWKMEGSTAASGMSSAMIIGAHLDKEKTICLSACRVLASFGGQEAIEALETTLSDDYWGSYTEIRDELPKLIAQAQQK